MLEKRQSQIFTEYKAKKFLEKFLPVSKSFILESKEIKQILQEKKIDSRFDFPLVLKLSSENLLHKSDIGGVKIAHKENFLNLLNDMYRKAEKYKADILVDEFISGQEIIIGLKKDETFGHVIGLGLGGIFVEVFKDISFRKCPIESQDFESMLDDLKAKNFFFARGRKINLDALKQMTIKVSRLPEKYKSIFELDLNPVIVNEKEAKIVDARIVFEK
jgi:acetate---CoA ligase (ADP-forming) subunit beta